MGAFDQAAQQLNESQQVINGFMATDSEINSMVQRLSRRPMELPAWPSKGGTMSPELLGIRFLFCRFSRFSKYAQSGFKSGGESRARAGAR